ncbi:hypothetical protein C8R43DRAFT_1131878 [Mycena crocata]|nr:hypothetical protein C8R43DRAFT_1131878 [Mycena crocata]
MRAREDSGSDSESNSGDGIQVTVGRKNAKGTGIRVDKVTYVLDLTATPECLTTGSDDTELGMSGFIKKQCQDTFKGLTGALETGLAKVKILGPEIVECRRSNLTCNGCFTCSFASPITSKILSAGARTSRREQHMSSLQNRSWMPKLPRQTVSWHMLQAFKVFCENSTITKVQAWWAHKISYPWLLPSLNRCLTRLPKHHWDLTPGDTNPMKGSHAQDNQANKTNRSLIEAILLAREYDKNTARVLSISISSGVLENGNNSLQSRFAAAARHQASVNGSRSWKSSTFNLKLMRWPLARVPKPMWLLLALAPHLLPLVLLRLRDTQPAGPDTTAKQYNQQGAAAADATWHSSDPDYSVNAQSGRTKEQLWFANEKDWNKETVMSAREYIIQKGYVSDDCDASPSLGTLSLVLLRVAARLAGAAVEAEALRAVALMLDKRRSVPVIDAVAGDVQRILALLQGTEEEDGVVRSARRAAVMLTNTVEEQCGVLETYTTNLGDQIEDAVSAGVKAAEERAPLVEAPQRPKTYAAVAAPVARETLKPPAVHAAVLAKAAAWGRQIMIEREPGTEG